MTLFYRGNTRFVKLGIIENQMNFRESIMRMLNPFQEFNYTVGITVFFTRKVDK